MATTDALDLEKAMKGVTEDEKSRCDSDPGLLSVEENALELGVNADFRRHHVNTTTPKTVSSELRRSIVERINDVYDPFIGHMLSQDNDLYDGMTQQDRVENLLRTPKIESILRKYRRSRRPKFTKDTNLDEYVESSAVSYTPTPTANEKTKLLAAKHKRESGKEKTANLWHALLTLLKAFVGTGVLFLPNGFRSGGIIFSPICLVFIAAFTIYAMLRLLQCRKLVGGTFGHIGYKAFGIWGQRMVQSSIILMQAGFCCTYVIFVAQNMNEVLSYMGVNMSTGTLILLQTALYIPLSWIRYISYFSISNLIADVFILYGLVFILGNSFSLLVENGPQPVVAFNQNDNSVFIGTAVFTFEGIGLILPVQGSLNKTRQKKFPMLLCMTVLGLVLFYSFFASTNYVAFGENIRPMVTSSLPRNGWSISVQFGYSIAQLLSYPLFLFPAVKIIEELLGFAKRASGEKVKKNIIRALAVIITITIAYFGQARLDLFVSIVGAFCCVPLSFIYPPLFYLKLNPKVPFQEKVMDITVIVFGIATFFFVTYSNLKMWEG